MTSGHERLGRDPTPVGSRLTVRALPWQQLRRGGEHLVAQVHDDQLRRQRLVGRPGRALVLAAPALGAADQVQPLLPGQVGDLAGAEDGLLGHLLRVEVRGGAERAQRLGPPGEEHVGLRHEDVHVLGVQHEHEEAPDDGDLQQDEGRLDVHVGAVR